MTSQVSSTTLGLPELARRSLGAADPGWRRGGLVGFLLWLTSVGYRGSVSGLGGEIVGMMNSAHRMWSVVNIDNQLGLVCLAITAIGAAPPCGAEGAAEAAPNSLHSRNHFQVMMLNTQTGWLARRLVHRRGHRRAKRLLAVVHHIGLADLPHRPSTGSR